MIVTGERALYVSAMRRWVDVAGSVRMVEAMEDALAVLKEETRVNIPVESGALAEDANSRILDFQPGRLVQGGVSMMKNGMQKPYAWMREKGTIGLPGGVLTPLPSNRRGLLFWVEKETGELKAARRVFQAGSHYMERSLENTKDRLKGILGHATTQAAYDVFD